MSRDLEDHACAMEESEATPGLTCDLSAVLSTMKGAYDMLRESAKQHRLDSNHGNASMCELHAARLLGQCVGLRHQIES